MIQGLTVPNNITVDTIEGWKVDVWEYFRGNVFEEKVTERLNKWSKAKLIERAKAAIS